MTHPERERRDKGKYKPFSAEEINAVVDFLRGKEKRKSLSPEEELETQLKLVSQLGKFSGSDEFKKVKGLEKLNFDKLVAIAATLTRRLERLKDEDTRRKEREARREQTASYFKSLLKDLKIKEANFLAFYIADWCLEKGYQVNKNNTLRFLKESLDIHEVKPELISTKIGEILDERRKRPVWKESAPRVERAEYAVRDLERTKIDDYWKMLADELKAYIEKANKTGGKITRSSLLSNFNSVLKGVLPSLFQEQNWEEEFQRLDLDNEFDQLGTDEQKKRIEKVFHVYRFNIGNPGEFGILPSPEMQEAYQQAIERHGGYGHSFGEPPLRRALAGFYTRRLGLSPSILNEQRILVGAGASEIIAFAMRALAEKEEAGCVRPIYPLYTSLAGELGINLRSVPVREKEKKFIFDPEEPEKVITPKTRYLIINSPNNPTGMVYSEEIIKKIVAIAKKYSLIIISDEIYADDLLTKEAEEQAAKGTTSFGKIAYEEGVSCLVVGGASKGGGEAAGWRVGWGAFLDRDKKADKLWENMQTLALARLCSNVPAQYAVIPALTGAERTSAHLRGINERIKKQRNVIAEYLNNEPLSCPEPHGAYYAFFKIKGIKTPAEENAFAKFLLMKYRVHIVPGSGFGYRETPEESGWFRLVFLANEEELKAGCQQIKEGAEKWLALSPEDKEKYSQEKIA